MGSTNDRWGQNDESQDQCSFAGKLQAAGKLQVCREITFASKTTRATELQVWEGITCGRKSQAAGKSLRVGKCMSGRKLRSRRKCRSGSDFQVRGNYKSAAKLHLRGICKSAQNDEKFLVENHVIVVADINFLVNLWYD